MPEYREFGFRSRAIAALLMVASPALLATPLKRIASHNESSLSFQYLAHGSETRCGEDLFAVEQGEWKCLRREGGGLRVVAWGSLGTQGFKLIRGPLPDDPRVVFAVGTSDPDVYMLDPSTAATERIGQVSGLFINDPILADHDGDGIPAWVVQQPSGATIVTLPPAPGPALQVVRQLDFMPASAGQFDADPQSELARGDGLFTRFIDSSTMADEEFTVVGGVIAALDWDKDGRDELVLDKTNLTYFVDLDAGTSQVLDHQILQYSSQHHIVHWQAADSVDLAFWGIAGLVVVDPRKASVIEAYPSVPGIPSREEAVALPIDWDLDGDGDLLWSTDSEGRLYLLTQPSGLSIPQFSVVGQSLAGYIDANGSAAPAFSVLRNAPEVYRMELQVRDPLSLDLLTAQILPTNPLADGDCELADLHPSPGSELLCVATLMVRMLAMDGTLLWSLPISDSRWRFGNVTPADDTCHGADCSLLVLQELGFGRQDLRLVDARTGQQRWSLTLAGLADGPQLLTDLDADGQLDLVYVDAPGSGSRVNAIDIDTRTLRWRRTGFFYPDALAQSSGPARRLAVVEEDSNLSLLDPKEGTLLAKVRVLPPGQQCGSCEVAYLRANDTFGEWVIANTAPPALNVIDRNLRPPIWTDPKLSAARISTRGDSLLHVVDYQTIHAYSLDSDGIFADGVEGW